MTKQFHSAQPLRDELLGATRERLRAFGLETTTVTEKQLDAVIARGVERMRTEGLLDDAERVDEARKNAVAFGELVASAAEARRTQLVDEETMAIALARCPYWPFCL